MRSSVAVLLLIATGGPAEYRKALPGYQFEFPRDHFNHPEFRTEWWYFTGNLRDSGGHRLGYELTFFRHGIDRGERKNVWSIDDVWFAHFAVSDIDGKRFMHTERFNRAGAGLAGTQHGRIWNGNWHARWEDDTIRLRAIAENFSINFTLVSRKPPVVHGVNGVSQKSAGAGRASHYISLTRLTTRGSLTIGGKRYGVEGTSWMDHEFFTHSLESNQRGWDWFSLQFDNGSELMLYRLRRKDGSVEPYSSGTYVDAQGKSRHLRLDKFELRPGRTWKMYPVEWDVRVPSLGIDVKVTTKLDWQEFTGKTTYWEGAVDVRGSHTGAGYLEMTGYAGPFAWVSEPLTLGSMRISRRAMNLWLGSWPVLSMADEPSVRFGLVTDVHHADKPEHGTRYYRESLRKLREGVAEFRSARVAFAVELGDLVDAAKDLDTERAWLKEAGREFRATGVDTHYVLGNHCVQTLSKARFLADVGQERGYYFFDRGGMRFIVLDACYRTDGVSYDAGNFDWKDTDIPGAEREWLRKTLSAARGKAIVFVHQRADVAGVHSVASGADVRAVLEDSGKVLAVFQGHSHQNDYREVNGIHYCTMRAIVEGSGADSSGYSVVSVYGDGRIHVKGFRAQRKYEL